MSISKITMQIEIHVLELYNSARVFLSPIFRT